MENIFFSFSRIDVNKQKKEMENRKPEKPKLTKYELLDKYKNAEKACCWK